MKKIVTYFRASGTTKALAETMKEALGCDIYEIQPEKKYTQADLDWRDKNSRSSVEMNDKSFRPAIKDIDAGLGEYDVIYVGFPIWWYVAPTIVNTFLEKYDLGGKKIVVFATSGGSKMGNTVKELEVSAKGAEFIDGGILNGKKTAEEIAEWDKGLGL